jgi:HrpA-like RNA helicase
MSRFENEEQYKTIAIHSDIPEDEQAIAFEPCKPNEIKIIIATNAAESSLTLPDVDFLIDLGQCKSMRYDSKAHKNVLLNTWISKASATQRAGRTGRVYLF